MKMINFIKNNKKRLMIAFIFCLLIMGVPFNHAYSFNSNQATLVKELQKEEIQTELAKGNVLDKDGNGIKDEDEGLVANLLNGNYSISSALESALKKVFSWNWFQDIFHWIPYLIYQLTSFILILVGMLFDLIINKTVIGFTITSGLNEGSSAVKDGWIVIRNFCNIIFIFVILWMAIRLVLNSDSELKKFMAPLIISALLINFSYLFAGFAVDVSNKLTTVIYTSTLSNQEQQEQDQYNVGTIILSKFSVQSFFGQKGNTPDISTLNPFSDQFETARSQTSFTGLILMIIITVVVAAVLFGNCVAFLYRFAILVFGLLLSPLVFVAAFLPQIKSTVDKWKSTFVSELIFAPVFFILLAISLNVMESDAIKELLGPQNFSGLRANSLTEDVVSAVLNVAVLIALLIGTLLISKTLGVKGAESADGAYKWLKKSGMGVVGGIGRNTIGRSARWLGQGYDKTAASIGGALKGFDSLGDGSVGKIRRGLGTALRIGAAATTLMGSEAVAGGLKEAGYATRGALKSAEESKFGTNMSLKEYEERDKKRARELSDLREKAQREKEAAEAGKVNISEVDWNDDNNVVVKAHKTIGGMTSNQIASLDEDVLKKSSVAVALSESVIKDLEKHDNFKDKPEVIKAIKEARLQGLKDMLDSGNDKAIQKVIRTADFAKLVGKIVKKGEKEGTDRMAERINKLTKVMTNNQLRTVAKENDNNEELLNGIKNAILDANRAGTANQIQIGNYKWLTKADGQYLYNVQTTTPEERSTADEL